MNLQDISGWVQLNPIRTLVGTALVIGLVFFIATRTGPTLAEFEAALIRSKYEVAHFTGQEYKDMNALTVAGKGGGEVVFTLLGRGAVYLNGTINPKTADKAGEAAASDMTTIRANGVLLQVWRYPHSWQASATERLGLVIRKKEQEDRGANFCKDSAHEFWVSCSKSISFTRENFYITISNIKDVHLEDGGRVLKYEPLDDAIVESLHVAIMRMKL